jgi:hypothetical protein
VNPHAEGFADFLASEVMAPFYLKRLEGLRALKLEAVLKRKNPYLFKAKNIELAGDLAKGIVDAFLSSQEETVFGNLLEGFAIHVAQTLYGGFKSKRKSLDLEFEREDKYFLVGIKSGTNWGNSDQIAAMKNNFKAARLALRNEGVSAEIVAVNGCIYGRDNSPLKTDASDADKTYFKYAGQTFWQWLSGDEQLFRDIIAPIDAQAKPKDEAFRRAYNAKVNELTLDVALNFVSNGEINWLRLVDFVSAREAFRLQSAPSANATIEAAEEAIE